MRGLSDNYPTSLQKSEVLFTIFKRAGTPDDGMAGVTGLPDFQAEFPNGRRRDGSREIFWHPKAPFGSPLARTAFFSSR